MCWDSLDMKVGWFLSMQIPSVPQRIDFKTYLGFTDGVHTHDGCQPYEIKPSFVNGTRVPCEEGGRTPYCQRTCEEGYPKSYSADKTFGDEPYRVAGKSNVTSGRSSWSL